MTRDQAILEIRNFLAPIPRREEDKFLDSLLSIFDCPEGWLLNVSEREYRRIIKKFYYKYYNKRR